MTTQGPRTRPGGRTVPLLYGALTASLVVVVTIVASVVRPVAPPTLAELGPAPRDRIEESLTNQAIGPGTGTRDNENTTTGATATPGDLQGGNGSGGPLVVEVPAGRRCFGDPPRQTEDPHSPPCVFEVFKGDNGGSTARGVTATEIRIAVPGGSQDGIVEALLIHFNRRYEFYGRRLSPVFVPLKGNPWNDPDASRAVAEDFVAAKPFGVVSRFSFAINATMHRRLAEAGVVSVVSSSPGFDSDAVVDGWTWLVDPPLDVRLQAGGRFVCEAFNGAPARHAGTGLRDKPRRFAVVVLTEPGVRPDPGPLVRGLRGCGADFGVFDRPYLASPSEFESLMVELKLGEFTTVLTVSTDINLVFYQAASKVGYFPEWLDLGIGGAHQELIWAGFGRAGTAGQAAQAFGITPTVRVQPEAERPERWALREGGGSSGTSTIVDLWYQSLLVLAAGIQGAGPNLTPETFVRALRTMEFPNPNPGSPPYWQQRVGFGPGDPVFHDDYAIWWWNDDAPSQTSHSSSGRGSFCYLDRGGRFTATAFPADADTRLFGNAEPCR